MALCALPSAIAKACGKGTSADAEGVHASQLANFTSSSMLERHPGVRRGRGMCCALACSLGRRHEQSEAVAGAGAEREGTDEGGAPRHREVRDGVVREVARALVPVRGGAA